VHWILASTSRSFKIGEAVRPVGTLVNDRQAAIVVDSKRMAPTFPVSPQDRGRRGRAEDEVGHRGLRTTRSWRPSSRRWRSATPSRRRPRARRHDLARDHKLKIAGYGT
jgi:hypothetical protein